MRLDPRRLEFAKRPHQRMGRVNLVVAVSAYQEQILKVLAREQGREQTQRRRVGPLQVIKKDHQRMVFARQNADELWEGAREAVERLGGAKRGRRGLPADDQLDLRNDFGQYAPLRSQGCGQPCAPVVEALLAFSEQAQDESAEGLDQCAERDAARDLIEFAGDEISPLTDDRLGQLLKGRWLADARITGDQHQRGRSLADAIERGEQPPHLSLSAVERLRNAEAVRNIAAPKRKRGDTALGRPFARTALQVRFQSQRALISLLGGLG